MGYDYSQPNHLPTQRREREPAPPEELPRQRRGKTPQMRGRYPDYDVLSEAEHWDETTRRVVQDRVDSVGSIRFFTPSEATTLTAFCDTVMAQESDPRIPVLAMVDAKLADGRHEGYQYADMPDDGDAWRLVARGLDDASRERGVDCFAAAASETRRTICKAFAGGELEGGVWRELPVSRAWSVVMRDILSAFYSHPWAWNEIGFGGPAYPRGYARLGVGQREAWEGEEAFAVDPVGDVEARGLD